MKPLLLAFLFGLLSCELLPAKSPHEAPSADRAVTVELLEPDESQIARRPFNYDADSVKVDGSIEVNALLDQIRIHGSYTTEQNIDPSSFLAFQAFDEDGRLLLRDGGRTPWRKAGGTLQALFDYAYPSPQLGLRSDQNRFTIGFNYVKEGEYWYDLRHPEARLPAFTFTNLDRGERFDVLFSWTPKLIPVGIPTWSFHLFTSFRPEASRPFDYRASVEARYLDDKRRDDNRRYALDADESAEWHLRATRALFERTGSLESRLGFVWEGKQWYKWGTDHQYAVSHVVPLWTYLLAALLVLAVLDRAFWAAARIRRTRPRRLAVAGVTVLSILAGLEFNSPILLTLLLMVFATILARLVPSCHFRLYWTLYLFAVAQEFIWSVSYPATRVHLHGIVFTLFLYGLAFAPVTAIRSIWALKSACMLALLLITSFYLTMHVYVSFFGDYPTLNILSYAGQVGTLTDSISDLFQAQHLLMLVTLIWATSLVSFTRTASPQGREKRARADESLPTATGV